MKKYLVIVFLLLVFISCKAPKFYIGMNEKQFLSKNRVSLVEANGKSTVYKKVNYPFGTPPVVKFFYFSDGVLTSVDEGEREPDIIIQHK